ncbi:F-box domain-containing protein [Mycena chlorophos]|uniref:F-box domain-containing protein n=1 Tax=Mycena chlorophos TaxID=658473 RepID=A0A8H6VNI9_MYCCL|nr:F-box domain-containing protein [Mycena chlorophos]
MSSASPPSLLQPARALHLDSTSSSARIEPEHVDPPAVLHQTVRTVDAADRGPLSPIHRLPTELLVAVFLEYWLAFLEPHDNKNTTYTRPPSGVQQLVLSPLLLVAQVSSRWHTIAMNTPELWVDIFFNSQDSSLRVLGDEHVSKLLGTTMARSASLAVNILIAVSDGDAAHFPLSLELLGSISARWQEPMTAPVVLGAAPRLRNLTWPHNLEVTDLPLEQLKRATVRMDYETEHDLDKALQALARARESFRLLVEDVGPLALLGFRRPTTSANVKELVLAVECILRGGKFVELGGRILDALTLPSLERLGFRVEYDEETLVILDWPHDAFMRLCERSRLDIHLIALDLRDIAIRPNDLFAVMSSLPNLEELGIFDVLWSSGDDGCLLNAKLLSALTAAPSISPRLSKLQYYSMMEFDQSKLMELVRMRLSSERPFVLQLTWLNEDTEPVLLPEVSRELDELIHDHRIHFTFAAFEPERIYSSLF